jgi:hypothetical protein
MLVVRIFEEQRLSQKLENRDRDLAHNLWSELAVEDVAELGREVATER